MYGKALIVVLEIAVLYFHVDCCNL